VVLARLYGIDLTAAWNKEFGEQYLKGVQVRLLPVQKLNWRIE